jgi:uncharacterized protein with HEPN domain
VPSRFATSDTLADIVENAARIRAHIQGVDLQAFAGDGLRRDAVERCLERICEAAHRLGPKAAELMPDQPWADIRGMGNQLRHAYDRVGLDVVWNTVLYDVPRLAADAQRALAELGNAPESVVVNAYRCSWRP